MSSLMLHVERILEVEVREIVEELGNVDVRLREVEGREDDESRLERIVLTAYRRHLVSDLVSLEAFARDRGIGLGLRGSPQQVTQACTG